MSKFLRIISIIFVFILFAVSTILAQNQDKSITKSFDSDSLEWGSCPAFMPDSCKIAVLHGDPAEPKADIFFKLQGGTEAPNHWHHSAERMVLISGKMRVNYEGQDSELLTPGTYAYGPPELPHTASCESSEACVLFIAFNEPIDAYAVE